MDPSRLPMQRSGARVIHHQHNSFSDGHPPGHNGFTSPHGPMPVPSRPPGINGAENTYSDRAGLSPTSAGAMSKSPPNAPSQKNTKHVPCKFFYKGQCAAGDTCPYSHNPEPPEPCKFFLNGNCKYGNNCALPHYNSNGVLLNPSCFQPYRRPRRPMAPGARGAHAGMNGPPSHPGNMFANPPHMALLERHVPPPPDYAEYGSPPTSNFGSPGFEAQLGRSPPFRSALDAPLPPSFSSQDLPNIQKFGPNAMSVPANGGLGPLTSMSPTTSMATREAFGNLDTALHDKLDLGSSPPETRAEVAPRRIASNGRSLLQRDLPSSMPIREGIELFRGVERQPQLDDDSHEEDYVPSTLSDLLTPQEKMRRFSRSHDELGLNGRPAQGSLVGSPNSKVGSPSGASPSRFSGFFAEKAKRDAEAQLGSSPFGHVGSPLRNSSLPSSITKQPDLGGGSPSFGPISPPGFKERPGGVSSLSEQLRKVRTPSMTDGQILKEIPQHAQRIISATNPPTAHSMRKDRVMPTGSGAERIEEEDSCFFSMEDEKAA